MLESNKTQIKKELSELLAQYYDGSFSRMACDYIHATGMKEEEVEANVSVFYFLSHKF